MITITSKIWKENKKIWALQTLRKNGKRERTIIIFFEKKGNKSKNNNKTWATLMMKWRKLGCILLLESVSNGLRYYPHFQRKCSLPSFNHSLLFSSLFCYFFYLFDFRSALQRVRILISNERVSWRRKRKKNHQRERLWQWMKPNPNIHFFGGAE